MASMMNYLIKNISELFIVLYDHIAIYSKSAWPTFSKADTETDCSSQKFHMFRHGFPLPSLHDRMTWLRRKTYWLCLLGSRAQCWSFSWFYSWFNNNNNPRTLVRQGQFFQDCRIAPVSISLGVQTDRFFLCITLSIFHIDCSMWDWQNLSRARHLLRSHPLNCFRVWPVIPRNLSNLRFRHVKSGP
jgi:hypothetical protein